MCVYFQGLRAEGAYCGSRRWWRWGWRRSRGGQPRGAERARPLLRVGAGPARQPCRLSRHTLQVSITFGTVTSL